jgi:hypothetical protein
VGVRGLGKYIVMLFAIARDVVDRGQNHKAFMAIFYKHRVKEARGEAPTRKQFSSSAS